MVRYRYIESIVYDIYKSMDQIKFPLNLHSIIETIPNCRHTSYQRVACKSRRKVQEVIDACESSSGCTYYDRSTNRYLIMTNEAVLDNNAGRRRWTLAHEIGHILCGHFELCPYIEKFAENNSSVFPEYEKEADYFAATILAPMPLFEPLNIRVAEDVQRKFMLSGEASRNRINDYTRWKNNRQNIMWDNDMQKLFLEKS